jgi:dihydrofolate synthase / folylpolyglutamate synthase
MEYNESISYLYSLGHETLTMKLGLENITRLAEYLGHPETKYPTVHVAGTNGKGSFCAMLASILSKAGIQSGLFISPHLINIEERFRFNLEPINRSEFCSLTEKIKTTVDRMIADKVIEYRPTFFEHVTAMAFEYFRLRNASLSIIEVGLGGRYDSTNIIKPVLSVITMIDLDHQKYLGNTISEIANEKAGILKTGIPALIAPQQHDAAKKIEAVAKQTDTPLTFLDSDRLKYHKRDDGFWSFDLISDRSTYTDIFVGLRGRHQVITAALSILASEYLIQAGFKISIEDILNGISGVDWPGRLELIEDRPLILLDGAHNPAGVSILSNFLAEWLIERKLTDKDRTLIFSVMRDKDIEAMAQPLFQFFDNLILVKRDDPRSFDFNDWQNRFKDSSKSIFLVKGAEAALNKALSITQKDGLIVVTGSLHLIGDIKSVL